MPSASRCIEVVKRFDLLIRHGAEAVAVVLMCVYTTLCLYQVVARFLVDVSADWTESLSRMLMIWSVFLGASALFREGTLISVDFVQSLARGRFKLALNLLHVAGATIVLGTAVWYGFQLVWRVRFQTLAGVEISMAWAYAAVPVGAVLCLLALLSRLFLPETKTVSAQAVEV
jgi:TRAP-type C4-dicarboxylate transport system permease small subunit